MQCSENDTSIAELTWGVLISLTRNIFPAVQAVKCGNWNKSNFTGQRALSNMSLGVIGLNGVGYKIAQYGIKFGMDVFYFDPEVRCSYPGLQSIGALSEIVAGCDVVTVHVQDESSGIYFGSEVFALFKEHSYFVNLSQYDVVDYGSLLKNLQSGHLSGVACELIESVPGFKEENRAYLEFLEFAKDHDKVVFTPPLDDLSETVIFETEQSGGGNQDSGSKQIVKEGVTWALIPARGGSKSIPLKNLALLNGKPLISYAINAGKETTKLSRIYCSTDSEKIKSYCLGQEILVQDRLEKISGDDVPTIDVIMFFLEKIMRDEGVLPEFLVLLEPTSPFVKGEHIESCVNMLLNDPEADSAQTVTKVLPNSHAYNQRFHDEGGSHFLCVEERKKCINKQMKPEFFIHGNVRVMRVASLFKNRNIFGEKSLPLEISQFEAMDADGPDDFTLAESILNAGLV